jgi:hypothetical protein
MLILVVNHTGLPSWLTLATGSVLSAAETLVPVSGVAVGMVFGRRWHRLGGRAVALHLWARARKIYLAAVVLVALTGLATLVPGLATEAVTVTQHGRDLYAFDDWTRALLAIVTLEAGPWQTSILGFFVVALAATPLLLWVLVRGGWWALLLTSAAGYATGRAVGVDVLPTQSEGPFPILVWQLLFVGGLVVGFHRRRVEALIGRLRGGAGVAVGLLAVIALGLQLGLAPASVLAWQADNFDKATLDPLRVLVMGALAAGAYLVLHRHATALEPRLGWVLLPLGRNSFYVFIVHVPICLGLASVLGLTGDGAGLGMTANTVVLLGCIGTLLLLIRHEVLFRIIPR